MGKCPFLVIFKVITILFGKKNYLNYKNKYKCYKLADFLSNINGKVNFKLLNSFVIYIIKIEIKKILAISNFF